RLGGRFARLDRLFLGGQDHDHLSPFQLGHGFNLAQFAQVVAYPFQHTHTEFLVSHLAAPETQGDLRLVALFEEALEIAQLHLVVAFVCSWTELDLFNLDDLLLGLRLLLALLLLVLELAIVHELAHGRGSVLSDLDEIDFVLLREVKGFGRAYDAELFTIQSYESYLGDTDFTIDAMSFFGCDIQNS